MHQTLDLLGLRYEVENGEVVLYPVTNVLAPGEATDKKVTCFSDRRSVQYIVIDLAKQVGLGYNFNKSFAQTDPECRAICSNLAWCRRVMCT